jgi:hypothetical protein
MKTEMSIYFFVESSSGSRHEHYIKNWYHSKYPHSSNTMSRQLASINILRERTPLKLMQRSWCTLQVMATQERKL